MADEVDLFEGQTFSSYDEFDTFLKHYCELTSQTFVVDDSKTIESVNAKLLATDKVPLPKSLKYSFLKLTCVKFGTKHAKKCRTVSGVLRHTQSSQKSGCPVFIRLVASNVNQKPVLRVTKVELTHNHQDTSNSLNFPASSAESLHPITSAMSAAASAVSPCPTTSSTTVNVEVQWNSYIRQFRDAATQCDLTSTRDSATQACIGFAGLQSHNIGSQTDACKVAGCDITTTPVMQKKRKLNPMFSSSSFTTVETSDTSYHIEDDFSSSTQTSTQQSSQSPPRQLHQEDKYIVFKICLWSLFENCPVCTQSCDVSEYCIGTLVVIMQHCVNSNCQYSRKWASQPFIASVPAGNILLSAAILFNGASHRKILKVLASIGISAISESTYLVHARKFLQPTIYNIWCNEQKALLDQLAVTPGGIVIGGDGRADSPGHSAKFGSYTTLELRLNKILDIQLVQSNEVGGSYHMELEGLKRTVDMLWKRDFVPAVVITDRHASVQKWIRESLPDTVHYYDVWHVAKGVAKKLEQLANQRGCESVKDWIKSISNHLYYSAASSVDESSDMIVAKWKSVVYHVQNIHEGHDDPLFDRCSHLPIDSTNQRKWLLPNTKASEKLADILLNKRLLKDVKKLSPLQQTSSVEAFHSLVIQFAPKSVAFSYKGMYCRLLLSALHYNENARRAQARDRNGELVYTLRFPKYKKGGFTVQPVLESQTFDYISTLMTELTERTLISPDDVAVAWNDIVEPPALCSEYHRPETSDAVKQHTSRFVQN